MVGLIIIAAIDMYTLALQSWAKDKMGRHVTSYSELGAACYGQKGKLSVDVSLLVTQIGVVIGYLLFVGKTTNRQ